MVEKTMDNIIFEKIWEDETLIQIKITAISKYITAFQNCYVNKITIEETNKRIKQYIDNYNNDVYIQFGEKIGNYTPAFSMNILKSDIYGHVKIEVDLEIDDTDDRSHRAKFFVVSELGAIEKFRIQFLKILENKIGATISIF